MQAAAPAAPAEPGEAAELSEPPLDPLDLPYLPYEVDGDILPYERQIVANKNKNLEVHYRLGLCPADRLRETVEANVKLAEEKRRRDLVWNRTVRQRREAISVTARAKRSAQCASMEAESIQGVEEDVRLADVPLPPVDIRVPNGGELKASPCSALNIIVELIFGRPKATHRPQATHV